MDQDDTRKVSVIIPAYNAERYIENCLDSLIRQTYKNIEIILTDDGSVDSTGGICDTYQRHYKNMIKVEHSKHRGAQRGRLTGLQRATGEYVVFVDADDWVEDDFIASLLCHMEGADIVATGISRELLNEKGNIVCEYNGITAGEFVTVSERKELYRKMLYAEAPFRFGVLPYMCNKMFRKDVMRALMEKVNKRIYDGEDAAVIYPYLLLSRKIVLTDECKYHYVNHSDSVSLADSEAAYLNAAYLYQELYTCFAQSEYRSDLLPQLDHYMRRMIWKKEPAAYLRVNSCVFPYTKVRQGSKMVLYGMGKVGKAFFEQIRQTRYCDIVAWADRAPALTVGPGVVVLGITPDKIMDYNFDCIVIAVENKMTAYKISEGLRSMGIGREKIVIPDFQK